MFSPYDEIKTRNKAQYDPVAELKSIQMYSKDRTATFADLLDEKGIVVGFSGEKITLRQNGKMLGEYYTTENRWEEKAALAIVPRSVMLKVLKNSRLVLKYS